MRHSLEGVHDGTCKVVGWVHFIFISRAVVNGVVASKDDGITESFVLVVN